MDEFVVAIAVPAEEDAARAVLTYGRRLAGRLGARWVAFRVHSRSVDPRRDESTLRLRQLVAMQGGDLLCAAAADDAGGLVAMATRELVDVLVLGPSHRLRFFRRWIPGMTEKLLRSERRFDVVVTNPERFHD